MSSPALAPHRPGPAPSRPTRADALRAGVAAFHTGQRVDVQAVAAEIGVSRVTLYRWVGTRERFLSDVMSHLCLRTIDRAAVEADHEALTESHAGHALIRFAQASIEHPGVQRMWREEAALFTRLTAGENSEFQARLVAATRALLVADLAAGRVDLPDGEAAIDDVAFAAVRITETFVHTKAITGGEPDARRCARVLHALLRPPTRSVI